MRPFLSRRAKRRTFMVTLVAWGLALVAGMVNACVLQEAAPGHHGQLRAHTSAEPEAQAPESQTKPSGDAGEHEESCKQFCDSAASTTVQRQNHDPADLGQAAAHFDDWTPSLAPVALAKLLFYDRPPPNRLPIAIHFLRLTL